MERSSQNLPFRIVINHFQASDIELDEYKKMVKTLADHFTQKSGWYFAMYYSYWQQVFEGPDQRFIFVLFDFGQNVGHMTMKCEIGSKENKSETFSSYLEKIEENKLIVLSHEAP